MCFVSIRKITQVRLLSVTIRNKNQYKFLGDLKFGITVPQITVHLTKTVCVYHDCINRLQFSRTSRQSAVAVRYRRDPHSVLLSTSLITPNQFVLSDGHWSVLTAVSYDMSFGRGGGLARSVQTLERRRKWIRVSRSTNRQRAVVLRCWR